MLQFFKKLFASNKESSAGCCGGGCCHASQVTLDIPDSDHAILAGISESIVIGKIIGKRDHKDEKVTKVKVCEVDVGGRTEQILCGGTNADEGKIVPVALVGTKLSEDFEIGERDIRGEISRGMICAKNELGLEQSEPDGVIWELPSQLESKLGAPLRKFAKS